MTLPTELESVEPDRKPGTAALNLPEATIASRDGDSAVNLLNDEQINAIIGGVEPSRLLNYLPGIYSDEPFLGRFLRIFESIWSPLESQIDHLYTYFDPRLTPAEFLPWLGSWIDLVLDENWPEDRRRALITSAADLYRRRGTAGALRDYLTIYMGAEPEVIEDMTDQNPFHFTVRFRVPNPDGIDRDRIQRIIEEEKPAHTTYTLIVDKSV